MNKSKVLGQVFTPYEVAEKVISMSGFTKEQLPELKILENSCGEGIFVRVLLKMGANPKNIYVIDIDNDAIDKFKNSFPEIPNENIYLGSAFDKRKEFFGKFDLVVGNPPYIRIHNLDEQTKLKVQSECSFCKTGMTDLFLAFFNLGIDALKNNGVLSYITPSSYIKSLAGRDLRKYIDEEKVLKDFHDYGEQMLFDGYTTYTCITTIQKNCVNPIQSPWTSTREQVGISCENIQNGVATLKDAVFIKDNFGDLRDEGLVKTIIKASTMEKKECIYPYLNGSVIPEESLKTLYPKTYSYLLENKQLLESRSITGSTKWYEYGRSQGIRNMDKEKIVLSGINKIGELRYERVSADVIVYSGLFATGNLDNFEKQLKDEMLIEFLCENGTPKRGGYYSYGSTVIKNY